MMFLNSQQQPTPWTLLIEISTELVYRTELLEKTSCEIVRLFCWRPKRHLETSLQYNRYVI
jgi:hypothetical protein